MEFANPLDAYITAATLGRRKAVTTTIPCEQSCERIAALLRRGFTRGIGQTEWLRTQFTTASARVTMTSPSTLLLYPKSDLTMVVRPEGRRAPLGSK